MEIHVNIDCADLDRMVDFYTAALGYEPYGKAGDHYASIVHPTLPKLVFQKVAEPRAGKNRVHLDLIVGDTIEAEAERFVGLGARRLSDGIVSEYGVSWIVMADPEGNEICLCDS
jgi:catechol 2,3-dioxygenase-like lactoylglutathione lyase family enzyme